MSAEIHEGDIGTAFRLTVKDGDDNIVNLSTMTSKTMYFLRPDGTLLTKTASLVTDGSDGKMQYVSTSGDISQAGVWSYQGRLVGPSGTWSTDIHKFRALENLG